MTAALHHSALDLTGRKFGRLTAIAPTEQRDTIGGVIWHCECGCGNFAKVSAASLNSGNTRSCGCLYRDFRDVAGREATRARRRMGLKTWGRLGEGNSRTGRPGFMSRRMDSESRAEVEKRNADRRRRGLCESCGRPLAVSNIEGSTAILICSCGFRTEAKRGSRAYRNAALIASGGR